MKRFATFALVAGLALAPLVALAMQSPTEVASASVTVPADVVKAQAETARAAACRGHAAFLRAALAKAERASADANAAEGALAEALAEKAGIKATGRAYALRVGSRAGADGATVVTVEVVAFEAAK